MAPDVDTLQIFSLRLLRLLGAGLGAALFLPIPGWGYGARLGSALMALASVYVVVNRLKLVTGYPFSLGWRGGEFSFPSYFAPGRHGLWGLVFMIPGVSIQVARLWDAILWTVPYFLLGLALSVRTGGVQARAWRGAVAPWSLLFINQGPIYAPLIVSGLILAVGYDRRRAAPTAAFTIPGFPPVGVRRRG